MSNAEMQPSFLGRSAVTDKTIAASSPRGPLSRRSVLASGAAVGARLLIGRIVGTRSVKSSGHPLKEYDIATNGITLHVTEQGEGPAVLFCHGFPDTGYTWRRQIQLDNVGHWVQQEASCRGEQSTSQIPTYCESRLVDVLFKHFDATQPIRRTTAQQEGVRHEQG